MLPSIQEKCDIPCPALLALPSHSLAAQLFWKPSRTCRCWGTILSSRVAWDKRRGTGTKRSRSRYSRRHECPARRSRDGQPGRGLVSLTDSGATDGVWLVGLARSVQWRSVVCPRFSLVCENLPAMRTRPHSSFVQKLKTLRCSKCGGKLNPQRKRCKRCSKVQLSRPKK